MSHPIPHVHNVYGAWYDYVWYDYNPVVYVTKKAAQAAGKWYYGPLADEQKGAVGGTIIDHAGLLGKPGARVSAAALRDAMERKAPGTTKMVRRVEPQPSDPDYKPPPEKKGNILLYAVIGLTVVVGGGIILATRRRRSSSSLPAGAGRDETSE